MISFIVPKNMGNQKKAEQGLAIAKEIVRIHIEITQLLFALGSTDVDDFISQTKYKFDRNNNVRIWSDDEKNIKFIVITEWIE